MEMNRRSFLSGAALLGAATLGIGGLAGCAPQTTSEPEEPAAAGNDWLGEPPAFDDKDCVDSIDAEIVVVGAGMSGYFAACAAAENGASVVLLEKGERGNGIRCSAIGAIDSGMQKERGVAIDKMDIVNDFTHYALNCNNADLLKLWADNSGEAVDWYKSIVEPAGLFVELEWNMPTEPTRYRMWPTGHGTVAQLNTPGREGGSSEVEAKIQDAVLAYYESRGGKALFKTKLECLITDSGSVVGAYAANESGGIIRVNASKGVVLATGGYAYNEAMMDALQPEFKKSLAGLFAFPTCTGDGIKAALWAGADLDAHPANVLFDRGAVPPDCEIGDPYNDTTSVYFSFGSQPFLKVDANGNRLCNESSPYLFAMNAAAQKGAVNRSWYPIWDSNWANDVERFHTIACSTLLMRDGGNHDPGEIMGIEYVTEQMRGLVEQGYIVEADSLEELARELKLGSTEAFVATVNRYNELYEAQSDADFGKDAFRLSAIKEPPFYGVKLGGQELATLHGIRVNTEFQALNAEGEPIRGLYMIGNDQGSVFADIYPNFAAGASAGRCATFGRMVGKALAAQREPAE